MRISKIVGNQVCGNTILWKDIGDAMKILIFD